MVRNSLIRRALGAGALAAGACALAAMPAAAGASGPTAGAARTISLNDSAHLHKTSSHGFNLYEAGQATGSLGGSVSMHLDVVSTNRVTAQLTVSPHGGSMSGNASGSYHVNGGTASFSGTLTINSGSGSYAHAHGSGLSFSGTIQRSNDAVTVHVSGHIST
ncbi:MAG TPA: autotransporter [Solirubrobacteraceae bacterium]|nr:autotransporter [Solirubrobacteraceae bacterium]